MNLNMLSETFRQALKNIASNKFRTLLTMLGIIIGIMAVIVIVGLGNGMTQSMRDSFSSMGTNTLTVSVPGFGSRTVDVEEMYALADENPDLFEAMSPVVTLSGSVKVGTSTLDETSATGVSEAYLDMAGYTVEEGRGIQYVDIDDNKKVCVVGAYIDRVGYGGNALGQTIKVGADQYTIVGVLEAQVSDLSSQEGSDDDVIFVPYTTALRAAMSRTASSYTFTLVDESMAAEGKELIEQTLTNLFHSSDGFMVVSMSEMLDTMTSMVNMVIMVLTVIAGISLLVGGIGIMNIMMVSVTERTREIGIRKALGAKERYILALFVIEASMTSALGGVIGIVLGYLVSAAAAAIDGTSGGDSSASSGSSLSTLADSILPSTSEILYGIIDGSILSTFWESLTSSPSSIASWLLGAAADNTSGAVSSVLGWLGKGASYVCCIDGENTTLNTSVKYPVVAGGIAVGKNASGEVTSMRQLMPVLIDGLGAAWASSNGARYETADDMQVYLWYKGQYFATTLAQVDPEDYYLIGWRDNMGCAAGSKIRVLVAVKKD